MARPALEVRDAGTGDLDALMELYSSARFDQGQLRASVGSVRARLERAMEAGEVQVLIAFLGAEPAGYALLTTSPLLPLGSTAGPSIEHLHVVPALRRRGVGRALLRRALHLAQAEGAEQIACTVLPGDRDYTRYMARLGFAPAVVRRAVPVHVLRRRLSEGPAALVHTTDVVARRRSLRARLARSAAPTTPGTGVPTAS
ncbi:GNAT family N-acetyltransferase [Kineococcus sp. NBC_00420]|uniref:GNAT family N-acetyltransferase n=1 Tax=unclassified Kineococcus TaxID=2621656 RepID=UPI002E1E3CAD